jgi:uncharacterized membrane protein YraQ (UPF0718 family)
MKITILLFLIIFIAIAIFAWNKEPVILSAGLKNGFKNSLDVLPIILLTFAISGLLQALIPTEQIVHWIGKDSGWRGVWIGYFLGILAPGGPMTMFPIVGGLLKAGAGIGTLVATVTAWSMWGIRLILLETALISPRFALFKFACCFFVPLLTGGIAHLLLSRYWK